MVEHETTIQNRLREERRQWNLLRSLENLPSIENRVTKLEKEIKQDVWALTHQCDVEGVASYGLIGVYSCIGNAYKAKKNHRDMLENNDNEYDIKKIILDDKQWI